MTTTFTALRRLTPLFIAVAVIAATFSVQGADKRIVIIAGRPSHPPGMHEFRAGSMLLQKALSGVSGVTVEVYTNGWPTKTVDGTVVDDNAALDNADAILIYSDGGKGHPAIQRDHMKVIDALAAKGVGLGFAHYAVEVPAGVPGEAMQRWIGGYYETNFSVNPMWKPAFERAAHASGRARRAAVRHPRRVVLQHALDARCGGQRAPDADPHLQAK